MPKPVLVFIPGTMCDARLFAPQSEYFGGQRDIHIPEIKPARMGMAQLAAELLLPLPERFALAGLSLGGIIALEMLRQAPQRISHLALLNTNDGADNEVGRGKREADFQRAQEEGLEHFMRHEMAPRYLHPDNAGRRDLEDTIVNMALDCGAARWREQLDLLTTRQNARPLLAEISVPLLVACGAGDRICPPALHREMAAAAGLEARIFAGSGHLSTLESPGEVNQALAGLLAG